MPNKNKNKNKGGRNAFYFFMLDLKDRQGRKFTSMQQVQEVAGPLWQNMGPAERKPYNDRAEAVKAAESRGKMTALHENIDDVLRKEKEEKFAEQQMQREVQSLTMRLAASNSLGKHYFHIVHFNNFCTVKDRHYPAEIAVLRFNLEEGVLKDNIYHELVHPGKIPLGFAFEAKAKSDEYHKLPPPMDNDGCNIETVMTSFISFIADDIDGQELPPLFIWDRDIKMVKKIVQQLCEDFEFDQKVKIYSLEYLLFKLRNVIEDEEVWPTVTQSFLELERDVYAYKSELCCEYHYMNEVCLYCSKSIVTRLAYTVCDNCCEPLGIQLVPGKHVPLKTKVNDISSRANSTMSYYSCNKFGGRTMSEVDSASVVSMDNFDETDLESTANDYDSEWTQPAYNKGRKNVATSSVASSVSMSNNSGSQGAMKLSQNSGSTVRRPAHLAACISGEGASFNRSFPHLGRGRGRGVNLHQ